MKKTSSSKRWLQEHFSDKYVKRAKEEGYRARSVYKLIEIQERYKIIKPNMFVVDLGASPGGWSEYVVDLVRPKGRVIAVDILPMSPIKDVDFIQGDFSDSNVIAEVTRTISGQKVDVVLSDMAPNTSGLAEVDHLRSVGLVELAFYFARSVLKADGVFLAKIFQGGEFNLLLQKLRQCFKVVKVVKPEASRVRSKEVFLLAIGFVYDKFCL